MDKIISTLMLTLCLVMAACSNHNDEPEAISPIQFSNRDYTIVYGGSSGIPFTGGGDVYKLEASHPEVLGKFGIDKMCFCRTFALLRSDLNTLARGNPSTRFLLKTEPDFGYYT